MRAFGRAARRAWIPLESGLSPTYSEQWFLGREASNGLPGLSESVQCMHSHALASERLMQPIKFLESKRAASTGVCCGPNAYCELLEREPSDELASALTAAQACAGQRA